MKKCTACGAYRSRLHTCVICSKKLCGCCSIKSTLNDKRVCCDGTLVCGRENRRRYQAAQERALTEQTIDKYGDSAF